MTTQHPIPDLPEAPHACLRDASYCIAVSGEGAYSEVVHGGWPAMLTGFARTIWVDGDTSHNPEEWAEWLETLCDRDEWLHDEANEPSSFSADLGETAHVSIYRLGVAAPAPSPVLPAGEREALDRVRQSAAEFDLFNSWRNRCYETGIDPAPVDAWQARAALASSPPPVPAQRLTPWISVEDQLPEVDSGEVLVWLTGGRCAFDEWHTYREDPIGLGGPTLDMGPMWRDYEFEEITHWMPLPTAPGSAPPQAEAAASPDNARAPAAPSPFKSSTVISRPGAAVEVTRLELTDATRDALTVSALPDAPAAQPVADHPLTSSAVVDHKSPNLNDKSAATAAPKPTDEIAEEIFSAVYSLVGEERSAAIKAWERANDRPDTNSKPETEAAWKRLREAIARAAAPAAQPVDHSRILKFAHQFVSTPLDTSEEEHDPLDERDPVSRAQFDKALDALADARVLVRQLLALPAAQPVELRDLAEQKSRATISLPPLPEDPDWSSIAAWQEQMRTYATEAVLRLWHDDARILDWLQSKGCVTIELVSLMVTGKKHFEVTDGMDTTFGKGDTLRAAIDAASTALASKGDKP